MERRPKHWFLPKFRGSTHPASPSTLFSPIFSLAREKIGPPEASDSRKFATTSQSRLRRASSPGRGALGRAFYSANGLPFRTVWRMKRKVAGSPCLASMVSRKRRRFIVFGWTRRDSCARSRYCRAEASV